ncbi:MAG: VCBS repeat-containing protein [Phycisphaerales bacterium]
MLAAEYPFHDLDGDSDLDMVAVNDIGPGGARAAQQRRWDLAEQVQYTASGRPTSVTLGDLNADSVIDIVVGTFSGNSVSVLIGNGDGTFAMNTRTMRRRPVAGAGDVDGDNDLDIIVGNQGPNNVSVLLNFGDGTFLASLFCCGDRHAGSMSVTSTMTAIWISWSPTAAGAPALLNLGDGTFGRADQLRHRRRIGRDGAG